MKKQKNVWHNGTFSKGAEFSILSIHVVTPDNVAPKPVGSGFVVGNIGKNLIAFTSSHVIEEVEDILCSRSGSEHHIPPDFRKPKDISIHLKKGTVRAAIANKDGKLLTCPIIGAVKYAQWDVSAIIIAPPDGGWTTLPSRFEIDTKPPEIGRDIAIMTFGGMELSDVSRLDEKRLFQIFHRRSEIRVGKILEFHPDGLGLLRGPCIRTNIPTTAGMSGGPIFYWDSKKKAPMAALAIVAADSSSSSAHSECTVAGDSTAVIIAATLPLRFELKFPLETVNKTVQNFIEDGLISDRSSGHKKWSISYPAPGHVKMTWNVGES